MLRRIFPTSRTEDRRLTFERKRFGSDLLIFPVTYSAEMWGKLTFLFAKFFFITNSTQQYFDNNMPKIYLKIDY